MLLWMSWLLLILLLIGLKIALRLLLQIIKSALWWFPLVWGENVNWSIRGRNVAKCFNSSWVNTISSLCSNAWFLKLTLSCSITVLRTGSNAFIQIEIANFGDVCFSKFAEFSLVLEMQELIWLFIASLFFQPINKFAFPQAQWFKSLPTILLR